MKSDLNYDGILRNPPGSSRPFNLTSLLEPLAMINCHLSDMVTFYSDPVGA